ncbi:MAG: sulfatase-like hydrolase/transferase [Acidobacteriota bacterium]
MMMWSRSRKLRLAAGGFVTILAIAGACREKTTVAREPEGARAAGARARNPDILLITIDTLRADAPGFAGNTRVETPTLDRLAARGTVFPNAHAHNVVTLPSHTNILTGLYPYQHGVRENSGFRLSPQVPTLATLLKAKGYATGAFVGGFPLDSRFGLNNGFDVYDDRYPKEQAALEFEMPERPAAEVIAAARKWYAEQDGRPRFLWVHLYDCHAPYRPPAPFEERYRDRPYMGEVAAVDAALEPLLTPFLEGQSPPTLIVLTSDHGEALGGHGEETHSLFAYEETLKVPLLVWFPRRVKPGVDGRAARHVDIAPTVAEVAGVPRVSAWPGASLLAPPASKSDDTSYFEAFSAAYNYGWAPLRGVVAEGYKFIDLPIPELYDLKADPSESQNLAAGRLDEVRRLRPRIPPESAIGRAAAAQPDSEAAARLRSLGYLSGGASLKTSYTVDDDPKRLVDLDRDMHRYQELYQRGDLGAATALARKVLEKRPTLFLAYVHLAFLLRRSDQPAAALEVYRTAVSRGIAGEELLTHYGLALCEAGRPKEAVKLLQPFADSSEPNTLNALGIALADAGSAPEALMIFQKVLRRDPGNLEAHENMGIVRLRAEDLKGARDSFLQALAIDDRSSRSWNDLGVAQARMGDEPAAVDSWSKAVGLDPTMYDALFNLGLTAAKVGQPAKAREALERFVASAPRGRYRADIDRAQGVLKSLAAQASP